MGFFISLPCIAYSLFSGNSDPTTMGLLMTSVMAITGSIKGLIHI